MEFQKDERNQINELLDVQEALGTSSGAKVESVKCRRILLARKTIFCRRLSTTKQAIDEVAQLTRLEHSHIVRVIGTYTLGKELSILMYPAAEYNLEEFLDELHREHPGPEMNAKIHSSQHFFCCLSKAVHYVHAKLVKHKDIKPQNILVRTTQPWDFSKDITNAYQVYLTDFGISRSYRNLEDVETDGPTGFTRKYAAPEVIREDKRGFSADIFSLGCVFLEIAVCLFDVDHYYNSNLRVRHGREEFGRTRLQTILATNVHGQTGYYANIDQIHEHVTSHDFYHSKPLNLMYPFRWCFEEINLGWLLRSMLVDDPQERPTADQLDGYYGKSPCCVPIRPPLAAMSGNPEE